MWSFVRHRADPNDSRSFAARLRAQRLRYFSELIAPVASRADVLRLLDVGGTPHYWTQNELDLPPGCRVEITVLNRGHYEDDVVRTVQGDARDMPEIGDAAFDVAYSNSVIEHVGTVEDQERMASEMRRVARHYFVQTPNHWFPIEPHFLFPLFQWLPVPIRAWLHSRFDLGWMRRNPDRAAARRDVEQIRLLTRRQLQALFPDGTVVPERVWGLTKSHMVHDLPTG